MIKVVGIGEHYVSRSQDEVIRTYALGSCVALTLYVPAARVGAMVHIVLPDSLIHSKNPKHPPGYYADTAVPLLIKLLKKQISGHGFFGPTNTVVTMTGGASSFQLKNKYNIGKRIVEVTQHILLQHKLPVTAKDVGGDGKHRQCDKVNYQIGAEGLLSYVLVHEEQYDRGAGEGSAAHEETAEEADGGKSHFFFFNCLLVTPPESDGEGHDEGANDYLQQADLKNNEQVCPQRYPGDAE